ncbi:MAG: PD40 domain-containing protein [Armatimonadetes bacterium]|nr:PD40 domain-containing protein [Armatimonadota bacterium]
MKLLSVALAVLLPTILFSQCRTVDLLSYANRPIANQDSIFPSVSEDGRYVAFATMANNLLPNDTNSHMDVYVYDRQTDQYELISVGTSGIAGIDASGEGGVVISPDGRFVAFTSKAANINNSSTWPFEGVFLRDRQTAQTFTVSKPMTGGVPNGLSRMPDIAVTDQFIYVSFVTEAENMIPGDGDGFRDVFVTQMIANGSIVSVSKVSVGTFGMPGDAPNGDGTMGAYPSISSDGRYIAFVSFANNFDPAAADGSADVFIIDRDSDEDSNFSSPGFLTTHVSKSWVGTNAVQPCRMFRRAMSRDARMIVFDTVAQMSQNDGNGHSDVYVRDRLANMTRLVSGNTSGVAGNNVSQYGTISGDGRFVSFASTASDLIANDLNGKRDIFRTDLMGDENPDATRVVSRSSAGALANNDSSQMPGQELIGISEDGRYTAFSSLANNLVAGDTNNVADLFLRDESNERRPQTFSVTVRPRNQGTVGSTQPSANLDGAVVAFVSYDQLLPEDTNQFADVYIRGPFGLELVSKSQAGVVGNGHSFEPSIDDAGRYIAFTSSATNLTTFGDTNNATDVFIKDRVSGQVQWCSRTSGGVQGNGDSSNPSMSGNSQFVAFASAASNLTAGDTNAFSDIFRFNRTANVIEMISSRAAPRVGDSFSPSASNDGNTIAFASDAPIAVDDNNNMTDIYVYVHGGGGTVTLASRTNGGGIANLHSYNPSISGDGRYVAFESEASNLTVNDNDNIQDIFVRDRTLNTTTLISINQLGAKPSIGPVVNIDGTRVPTGESGNPSISNNGRYVAFSANADNWVHGLFAGGSIQVFVKDRNTGNIFLASANAQGHTGEGQSDMPSISRNGGFVAFQSDAVNLVEGDWNDSTDIFVAKICCSPFGNINGDNIVDDLDLALLLEQFGQNQFDVGWLFGDINFDRIVDDVDLAIVLTAFGDICSAFEPEMAPPVKRFEGPTVQEILEKQQAELSALPLAGGEPREYAGPNLWETPWDDDAGIMAGARSLQGGFATPSRMFGIPSLLAFDPRGAFNWIFRCGPFGSEINLNAAVKVDGYVLNQQFSALDIQGNAVWNGSGINATLTGKALGFNLFSPVTYSASGAGSHTIPFSNLNWAKQFKYKFMVGIVPIQVIINLNANLSPSLILAYQSSPNLRVSATLRADSHVSASISVAVAFAFVCSISAGAGGNVDILKNRVESTAALEIVPGATCGCTTFAACCARATWDTTYQDLGSLGGHFYVFAETCCFIKSGSKCGFLKRKKRWQNNFWSWQGFNSPAVSLVGGPLAVGYCINK